MAADLRPCPARPIFSDFSVYLCGYVLSAVCVVGLFGNIYAMIYCIGRYIAFSTFRFYLHALCITDSIVLFSSIFYIAIPRLSDCSRVQADIMLMINNTIAMFYPIALTAQTASAWLTVAMTALRYLSIRFPFQMRHTTNARAAMVVVFNVLLASILFNIPRAFEVHLIPCLHPVSNRTTAVVGMTSLRRDAVYRWVYIVGAYTLLMCIVPLLLLCVCNTLIAVHLYRTSQSRVLLGRTSFDGDENSCRVQLISTLLATIALMYLLCNSLPVATNILEFFVKDENTFVAYTIASDVGNLLVCIQAGSNFIIYLMFSAKFRKLHGTTQVEENGSRSHHSQNYSLIADAGGNLMRNGRSRTVSDAARYLKIKNNRRLRNVFATSTKKWSWSRASRAAKAD